MDRTPDRVGKTLITSRLLILISLQYRIVFGGRGFYTFKVGCRGWKDVAERERKEELVITAWLSLGIDVSPLLV